jgi:hypothetical protein
MRNDDLERRVGRLEKTLTDISEELRLALRYVRPDAGSSLTKSRLILERILLQVYKAEVGHEPRKPLLGDMLVDNQFTRKIDRRILSRMNAIRDMGNLGPHGEAVEASDAARVLEDLCEVLDWYLPRYGQPGNSAAPPEEQPPPPTTPRRSRRWLLAMIGLLGAVGLAIGLWRWRPTPRTDDTHPSDPSAVSLKPAAPIAVEIGIAAAPKNAAQADNVDREIRVTHESSRKDGAVHIAYRLPYLEDQRAGKPIHGVAFRHDTFEWELPQLSVKVLNNSAQSVMLTECIVDVATSVPDTEPVLVIAKDAVNGIMLINEGWGPVVDPALSFKIQAPVDRRKDETAERHTLDLQTFTADRMVRLNKFIPKALEDLPSLDVGGEIEYGPAGKRKKTPFTTTMLTRSTVEHLVPPSQQYDLGLTAGKAPESHRIPISHNLKPGEADQFVIRVTSDKSARYEMTVRIRRIDGEFLLEQRLILDLFVPRSAAKRMAKAAAIEPPKPTMEIKQP